ncbi:unnamed protein product, partial [Staurois parvus]
REAREGRQLTAGVSKVSIIGGRNSAPSLVSVGGIVPHHWCQWGE